MFVAEVFYTSSNHFDKSLPRNKLHHPINCRISLTTAEELLQKIIPGPPIKNICTSTTPGSAEQSPLPKYSP
jgi:hypothetical protein